MRARAALWLAFAGWLSAGCTTIGLPVRSARERIDYGPRATIQVCVLRDERVSEARARDLVRAIDDELDPYGIDVEVPWVRPWRRPGFFSETILQDVAERPLEAPCDRLLALVSRNLLDGLWGLVLPEVLGGVETATHTRGFAAAGVASVNQLFLSPSHTVRHEFYHMLGCPHALTMQACYRQIAITKSYVVGSHGFPGLTKDLRPLRPPADEPAAVAAPPAAD